MADRMVIATANRGKLAEVVRILGAGYELLTLADFEGITMPEEDGETFADNAAIKAIAVARQAGLPALADDSGLAVDSLGGRPGVYSARFGSPSAKDDIERYRLLLSMMEAVPDGLRSARFVSAVALASPSGLVSVAEGKCEGAIIHEPRGDNGFGYDPIFVPEGMDRTYAELSAGEKDAISHRRRALEALLPALESFFGR